MDPNVLLVVLDATRADHTSVHGYQRPTTPYLEKLAGDGYLFENAFAAAPWTPPSHGSLFSGVHPTTHGFLDGGMPYTPPHSALAEVLRKEGYRTFGASQNSKITGEGEVTRGFSEHCDLYRLPFLPDTVAEFRSYYLDLIPGYIRTLQGLMRANRKPVEHLVCEYIRTRIRRYGGEDPFFGFINILAPHSKYAPPEPYRSRFDRAQRGVDEDLVDELSDKGGYRFIAGELEPTDREWDAVRDRYDGEIAFADRIVGMLVETLRDVGVYEETMVIVTADHGEHFGEHGLAYHQFSLFDELLHVPLIIKKPGGTAVGQTVDDLVSLVDLYPTVLSELGLSVPESVEGIDIFGAGSRDQVFAEYGEPETGISVLQNHTSSPVDESVLEERNHALQCVRTREQKYVRVHGGPDRIYEVGAGDPKDTLIASKGHDELAAAISEQLGTHLRVDKREPEDPKVQKNLEALGYR